VIIFIKFHAITVSPALSVVTSAAPTPENTHRLDETFDNVAVEPFNPLLCLVPFTVTYVMLQINLVSGLGSHVSGAIPL